MANFTLNLFSSVLIHLVPKYNSISSVCLSISLGVRKWLSSLCWELRTRASVQDQHPCALLKAPCTEGHMILGTYKVPLSADIS